MHIHSNMTAHGTTNMEAKSRRRVTRIRQEASDAGQQSQKQANPSMKKTPAPPPINLKESLKPKLKKKIRKVKDAGHSEENSTVLLDWIIKPLPDIRGVCVEGQKEGMEDFWHSSAIVEARKPKTVVTTTGSVYKLRGKINKFCTIDNGFSKDVAQSFIQGFPKNWKEIIQKFYAQLEESISIVAECSPIKRKIVQKLEVVAKARKPLTSRQQERATDYPKDSTSIWSPVGLVKQKISTNDVTITRSGRMSLPPLARWTGQHYRQVPGSNEIEVTFQTDYAKEILNQKTAQILQLPKSSLRMVCSSRLSKSFLLPTDTKPKVNRSKNKSFDYAQNVTGNLPEMKESQVVLCRELVSSVCTSPDSIQQVGCVKIPKIYLDNEQKSVNVEKSSSGLQNGNIIEICSTRNSNVKTRGAVKQPRSCSQQESRKNQDKAHLNSHSTLIQSKHCSLTQSRKEQNKTNMNVSKVNKLPGGNKSTSSDDVLETFSSENQKVVPTRQSTRDKKGRSKKVEYCDNISHSEIKTRKSTLKCPRLAAETINEADIPSAVAATTSVNKSCGNITVNPSVPAGRLKRSKLQKCITHPHSLDQPSGSGPLSLVSAHNSLAASSFPKLHNLSTPPSVPNGKEQKPKLRKHTRKDDSSQDHILSPLSVPKCHSLTTPPSVPNGKKQTAKTRKRTTKDNKTEPHVLSTSFPKLQSPAVPLSVSDVKKEKTKTRKRKRKDVSIGEDKEGDDKCADLNSSNKRRKVVEEKPEKDVSWKKEEKDLLQRALREVNGAEPDYWQKVCEIVQTRTETECQQFYRHLLEERVTKKHKKNSGKNPATKNTNGRKKGEPIRGGKGTLKRKQELRNFLDEQNDGYEDNLFDSTPLLSRKRTSSIFAVNVDKNDSEIFGSNHNCITPVAGASLNSTPRTILRAKMASLRKTPACIQASGSADTPVSINRRQADQYIKTFIDRKRKAGSGKPVSQVNSSILELSTLPVKSLFPTATHPSIVIDTYDSHIEDDGEDNPYMYYWDDES